MFCICGSSLCQVGLFWVWLRDAEVVDREPPCPHGVSKTGDPSGQSSSVQCTFTSIWLLHHPRRMRKLSQWHCSDPYLRPTLCLSHHTTVPPVGSGQLLLGQGHAHSHCQNDLPLDFYILPLVPFPSQLPLSQPFFFPLSLSLFSLLFSFLATKAPTNNSQLSVALNRLKGLECWGQDVYHHEWVSSWCLPPPISRSWFEQVTRPHQEKQWGRGLGIV